MSFVGIWETKKVEIDAAVEITVFTAVSEHVNIVLLRLYIFCNVKNWCLDKIESHRFSSRLQCYTFHVV